MPSSECFLSPQNSHSDAFEKTPQTAPQIRALRENCSKHPLFSKIHLHMHCICYLVNVSRRLATESIFLWFSRLDDTLMVCNFHVSSPIFTEQCNVILLYFSTLKFIPRRISVTTPVGTSTAKQGTMNLTNNEKSRWSSFVVRREYQENWKILVKKVG